MSVHLLIAPHNATFKSEGHRQEPRGACVNPCPFEGNEITEIVIHEEGLFLDGVCVCDKDSKPTDVCVSVGVAR